MSFAPDGYTLERVLGLPEDAPLDEVGKTHVPLDRWIRRLPSYAESELVEAVSTGVIPAPSVAPGVSLVAGFVATEVFNLLVARTAPRVVPSILWADALDSETRPSVRRLDTPLPDICDRHGAGASSWRMWQALIR